MTHSVRNGVIIAIINKVEEETTMEKGKEMVKAQADLPKKNAAPAEPAKSLEGTIQQVISKAVTSPTDAKIDFAQGVNHITGDPQQKKCRSC